MSRISIIAPTYLPSRRANTIQVMKNAQAMASLGHLVLVLVPGEKPDLNWDEMAHYYGLQHKFDLIWLPTRTRLKRYDFGLASVRKAQLWGADLIFTRLPQSAAIASMMGFPTILETHDLPQGYFGPGLFRRFVNGKGARRLVVITEALRATLDQKIIALPAQPFTLIAPDGVDLERFANLPTPFAARQTLREEFSLDMPERFTVGYTGHLYPGRGIELILDVAEQLNTVTYLLVGGNPADVNRVQQSIAARNLQNVILTGFIPNTDLPTYQAACEVLLMPYQNKVSSSSGSDIASYLSPMKVFEYLACGRGILSSDLPVLQEVLNHHNSILLPADDHNLWAVTIQEFQKYPERLEKMAQRARDDVRQYSWIERAARILEGIL